MKMKLLLSTVLLLGIVGLVQMKADTYTFDAADWAYTGDAGRIAPNNISVTNNVITLSSVTGDNNAALRFGGAGIYTFDHTATRLVIKGTNLSTDKTKHAVWWLNNANNNTSQHPVEVTESDGVVTLTWALGKFPYAMRKNTLSSWTLSNYGTSTIFGLTPATNGSDVTITDIEVEAVSSAYSFDAADWAYTGDAGRIAQSNISVTNNVITLASVSGDNNAALQFNGDNEYLFSRSLATITIIGTNLSATAAKHAFWWLNGSNQGGSVVAKNVTSNDGMQTITWDLTDIDASLRPTIIGEWEMLTRTAYESESWKYGTLFGLTPAEAGNVTITDIQLTMVDEANVVTREVATGRFGTICLPKVALPKDATVYDATGFSDGVMTFSSLSGGEYMTAGRPYLFKATADNPTFTMSGDAVSEPDNTDYMTGTFEDIDNVPMGSYVVSGTQLYRVNSVVTCSANRAYFTIPSGAPARISLGLDDDVPTGISLSVFNAETGVNSIKDGKYIDNGRIVIVKNGVKYSANGQILK